MFDESNYEWVSALVDRELHGEELQRAEQLLESDSDARKIYDDLMAIREDFAGLPRYELGAAFTTKVLSAIDAAKLEPATNIESNGQSNGQLKGQTEAQLDVAATRGTSTKVFAGLSTIAAIAAMLLVGYFAFTGSNQSQNSNQPGNVLADSKSLFDTNVPIVSSEVVLTADSAQMVSNVLAQLDVQQVAMTDDELKPIKETDGFVIEGSKEQINQIVNQLLQESSSSETSFDISVNEQLAMSVDLPDFTNPSTFARNNNMPDPPPIEVKPTKLSEVDPKLAKAVRVSATRQKSEKTSGSSQESQAETNGLYRLVILVKE